MRERDQITISGGRWRASWGGGRGGGGDGDGGGARIEGRLDPQFRVELHVVPPLSLFVIYIVSYVSNDTHTIDGPFPFSSAHGIDFSLAVTIPGHNRGINSGDAYTVNGPFIDFSLERAK